MSKINTKTIIDLFVAMSNKYKLVKKTAEKLSNDKKNEPIKTHDFLETNDISISLNFKNGQPDINFDTKKHTTKITDIL